MSRRSVDVTPTSILASHRDESLSLRKALPPGNLRVHDFVTCRKFRLMSTPEPFREVPHRGLITVALMLATIMQALDTTIANVALPYMQGTLSALAGPDQLGADLLHRRRRDHDRAGAGWLANRFGRKRMFIICAGRLHRRLGAVRPGAGASRPDGAVPPAAGRVRRRAGAAVAGGAARHLPAASATARRWRSGARASCWGRSWARRSAAG